MRNDQAGGRLGPLSVEEYLALEQTAPTRHEFVAGRIYPVAGTTARHSRIALNIHARLHSAAVGTPCSVYAIELKVRPVYDRIYYPDVVVVCTPHEGGTLLFDEPCLVLEVTSPSTRRTDRGEKLDAYLSMPSLKAYLIVEQDRRHVTVYSRLQSGEWNREEIVASGPVAVPCPPVALTLDDIYAGVELPPRRVREPDGLEDDFPPEPEWADDVEGSSIG